MVLGWGTGSLMSRYLKKSYHIQPKIVINASQTNQLFLVLVIATAKTSRTRSRVSVVVFQTPRFAFSIWEERELSSMTFPCAFISCPMSMNSWAPKRWKPVAFAATNTWWSSAARISSTSVCDCIHSTLFASTKCCPAPELIGKRILQLSPFDVFHNDELLEHWAMTSTMIKTNPLSRWLKLISSLSAITSTFLFNFTNSAIVLSFRLQTGMRGAFGKPQGTVARVRIGQPIMSVRSSDRYKAQVIEALRRAKFKFPGRQKVRLQNVIHPKPE